MTLLRPVPLALFAALLCAAAPAGAAEEQRTLSISGEGTAGARPDMATITAGVTIRAKTAREALDANNAATARVLEFVKGQGIEAKDLQTSGFSLQPVVVYPDSSSRSGDDGADGPRVTGYTASNSVTARIRDIGKLGPLLDGVVTAGANTIGGIDFVVSNESQLLDEARKAAVADARRKAELYAAAVGAKLGPVLSLSEGSAEAMPLAAPKYAARAAASLAAVPVEAGQSELRVQVSVTYRLD